MLESSRTLYLSMFPQNSRYILGIRPSVQWSFSNVSHCSYQIYKISFAVKFPLLLFSLLYFIVGSRLISTSTTSSETVQNSNTIYSAIFLCRHLKNFKLPVFMRSEHIVKLNVDTTVKSIFLFFSFLALMFGMILPKFIVVLPNFLNTVIACCLKFTLILP